VGNTKPGATTEEVNGSTCRKHDGGREGEGRGPRNLESFKSKNRRRLEGGLKLGYNLGGGKKKFKICGEENPKMGKEKKGGGQTANHS